MPLCALWRLVWVLTGLVPLSGSLALARPAAADTPAHQPADNAQTFIARGVVKEVKAADLQVVIAHEAITNYMDAMTMPFKVRNPGELAGLRAGDRVSFHLRVTDTESWVEQIARTGTAAAPTNESRPPGVQPVRLAAKSESPDAVPRTAVAGGSGTLPKRSRHPLMDFPFTNELGQRVTLGGFRGQALAITFFFTRCPIPDFCPRLSKNFQEASRKLTSLPSAPTNWHFLSVSFDTEFDTPAVLKAYGEHYQYDPKHWSFLTGPADKIRELASLSDVTYEKDNGFFNHNFRTLVIDTAGHLQMTFPIGGDLSEALTTEILKAAAVTNQPP
ncbi:MAG TPA: SCO family protein [Candidatus Acidoferrum sp.]|nr:SCO family protein [Candidatus Acidoferrum sp.]